VRLRKKHHIQSPLEYLRIRYNLTTQQVLAWSGVILKTFDVGAKWAAIGILLKVVADIPLTTGILVSGLVTVVYVTVGGLWGVIVTDFIQFVVQVLGGVVMFVLVMDKLGGWSAVTGIWDRLPASHSALFNEPYTAGFVVTMFFLYFLSYNGGSWSLATRYISSTSEKEAAKAARLSGWLYLVWPLILFFPMWAAPLLIPGLDQPREAYGRLMLEILPQGLIGLVIASLFAATMGMTSSDVNTIAAVITRDILPVVSKRYKTDPHPLKTARITTLVFSLATLVVALNFEQFGGVLGLIVNWFAALIGPTSMPLLLGLLPMFRFCGPRAAIGSIIAGLIAFVVMKNYPVNNLAWEVGLPSLVAGCVFVVSGIFTRTVPPRVEELMLALKEPTDQPTSTIT
jgi:Na+/proline symporter